MNPTELSFVSNTVSNHVQAAEMHNQSVNSLAMVSARYTAVAVQLTQMVGTPAALFEFAVLTDRLDPREFTPLAVSSCGPACIARIILL